MPGNIKWLSYFLYLHLFLAPFYVFSSGLPQPSDMIITLAFPVLLFSAKLRKAFNIPQLKAVRNLIFLILLVNLVWGLACPSYLGDFLVFDMFYLFNFFIAWLTVVLLGYGNNKVLVEMRLVIAISVFIQVALFLAGVGGKGGNELRSIIFFNNPNQLGYYTLVSAAMFGIIEENIEKKWPLLLSVIFLLAILVLTLASASRAASAGIIVMGALQFLPRLKLSQPRNVFYLIVFFVTLIVFYNSKFTQDRLKFTAARQVDRGVPEYKIRAYDRILEYPEYAVLGAGEGFGDRFIEKSYHTGEIHSAFGTVLFSYGILGIILFFYLLFIVWKSGSIFKNTIYLLPVLIYNVSHQGLRMSQFWILLMVMGVLPVLQQHRKKIVRQQHQMANL